YHLVAALSSGSRYQQRRCDGFIAGAGADVSALPPFGFAGHCPEFCNQYLSPVCLLSFSYFPVRRSVACPLYSCKKLADKVFGFWLSDFLYPVFLSGAPF